MNRILALMLLATLTVLAVAPASADDMKELVQRALKDGKADGVLDDAIARLFRVSTLSNEPVHVSITKIERYEDPSCGRLRIIFTQGGIKGAHGKLTTQSPGLELSICANGKPPAELEAREQSKRIAQIQACVTHVDIPGKKAARGSPAGRVSVTGCLPNGYSQWHYIGTCKAWQMPERSVVNFQFDKEGALSIPLTAVPAACKSAKNAWQALVYTENHSLVGSIVARQ